jgi:hypothetical protein
MIVLSMACSGSDTAVGVADDGAFATSAAAVNARRLPSPVWEAILSPLNAHVGRGAVTGKAVLTMDGIGNLTVSLDVKGVVPGQLHPQHIHGHGGVSTCPTPQADANGDGVVSVGEGVPDYGPVLVSLTPFQTPPSTRYEYEATFANQGALEPERRAIVVHGAFVNGVYDASLPVACGTVERVR